MLRVPCAGRVGRRGGSGGLWSRLPGAAPVSEDVCCRWHQRGGHVLEPVLPPRTNANAGGPDDGVHGRGKGTVERSWRRVIVEGSRSSSGSFARRQPPERRAAAPSVGCAWVKIAN